MSKNYTPCIIIPGIGQSMIELLDDNNNKIKMAWQLQVDTGKIINELNAPLIKTVFLRRDMGLTKKMAEIIAETADPIATNNDGTMKNNIRVVEYPQSLKDCTEEERRYIYHMVPVQKLSDIIGEDRLYFFAFNSFGEPYKIAEDLNNYIQMVKKEHNCEQVNIIPISLGGAMSIAYFDAYGSQNDIKRILYFVGALQGTPVISDLLSMNINTKQALSLIEFLFPRKVAEMLGKLLKALPAKVSDELILTAMKSLVDCAIVSCPALWATVPPEKYDELAEKYLTDPKYSVLKEKTDRFAKAQKAFPQTVKTMQENGVGIFGIVGYNLPLIPITAPNSLSSDSMIPVCSAALGATAAPLGSKLDKTGDYISPDGTIDASTSILPDTVWYFKDQQHDNTAYNDTALTVSARVLSDDDFKDVYSDPALPRFGVMSDNRK